MAADCIAEIVRAVEGNGARLRVRDGRIEAQGTVPEHLREALAESRQAVISYLHERERQAEAQRRKIAAANAPPPGPFHPVGRLR